MYVHMKPIKKIAEEFDIAIEKRDIREVLDFFSEDCEIELLGVKLYGKTGAKKWIEWLYSNAPKLQFEPVVIITEGNVFYEEFYVIVTLPNGKLVKSHQAETLLFENEKIKTLRIFFNPLDFSDVVTKGPISKGIVKYILKTAKKGLI
jgi:ketosteroid isomerase-like protein